MAGLLRRFSYMPSLEVLGEIEGVAIIEVLPPSVFLGRVTGMVLLAGEWPAGPFNTPTQVDSSQAVIQGTFGGFALSCVDPFSYASSAFTNPYSNGNAFCWLSGKKFRRLTLVRVDNSLAEGVAIKLTSSPAVAATGSIQIPAGGGASMTNGDWFVLDDGYNAPVRFEYRSSGSAAAGSVAISFAGGDTQATVATSTRTAINNATGLDITAAAPVSGLIGLTNDAAGEHGNVTILEGVANAGFLVTGMSGGTGYGLLLADLVVPAGTRVYDASSTDREFALAQSVTFAKGTNLGTSGFTYFSSTDLAKRYTTRTVARIPVTSTKNTSESAVSDVDAVNSTDLFNGGIGAGTALPYVVVQASTGALDGSAANSAALTVLTSSQYDTRYDTALQSTMPGDPAVDNVDMVASARESAAIRVSLLNNARSASSQGTGRRALSRPPIGTTLAGARGASSPGVGANRSKRNFYCYPHYKQRIPEIAELDPNAAISLPDILVGADAAMATVCSQLPPEYNPGQSTAEFQEGGILNFIQGLEPGLTNPSDATSPTVFTLDDYIQMKASGIACLRRDAQIAEWVFQSGVTSVDPAVYPSLAPINRARFEDFVNDSLAAIAKKYNKKVKSTVRFDSLVGEFTDFMELLLAEDQPDAQRIAGYSINPNGGNTAQLAGTGISTIEVKTRMLETLDVIAILSTVGATVDVSAPDNGA